MGFKGLSETVISTQLTETVEKDTLRTEDNETERNKANIKER
jgi:hypothetical protein